MDRYVKKIYITQFATTTLPFCLKLPKGYLILNFKQESDSLRSTYLSVLADWRIEPREEVFLCVKHDENSISERFQHIATTYRYLRDEHTYLGIHLFELSSPTR